MTLCISNYFTNRIKAESLGLSILLAHGCTFRHFNYQLSYTLSDLRWRIESLVRHEVHSPKNFPKKIQQKKVQSKFQQRT